MSLKVLLLVDSFSSRSRLPVDSISFEESYLLVYGAKIRQNSVQRKGFSLKWEGKIPKPYSWGSSEDEYQMEVKLGIGGVLMSVKYIYNKVLMSKKNLTFVSILVFNR